MDIKLKRYTSAGLVIESAFDLPGLDCAESIEGAAQLQYIGAEHMPGPNHHHLSPGVNWSSEGETLKFFVPDVAVFEVSTSGIVRVFPETKDLSDIGVFLVGSVLGIALHLRRIVTIHASAVKVGDGAVMFCGESGAGKSTMAAAFQMRGFEVLCDDLCALDVSRDTAALYSDGRKLKLWGDALERLGLENLAEKPVQRGVDKYFVSSNSKRSSSAPIRAIFELKKSGEATTPKLVPVSAAEAAALIHRNAYRPSIIEQLDDHKLYFEAAVRLVHCSSIYRLERAHDFDQIENVMEEIQRAW